MKVGFIGIGNMGSQMCRHLLAAGHDLAVFDVSQAAMAPLGEQGAQLTDSPADAARGRDATILMVRNRDQAEQVLRGAQGLLEQSDPNNTIVIMSTLSAEYVASLAAECAEQGMGVVDAPVSGGVEGAAAASLAIMAAGPDRAFAKVEPLLHAMGSHVIRMGDEPGQGQTTKVLNQMMYFSGMAIASEAVVTASKYGIDPDQFIKAVSQGSGDNWALRNRVPLAWRQDYRSGGRLDIASKDIAAALELGRSMGVDMHLGATAAHLYRVAEQLCGPEADDPAYVLAVETLARHRLREG